MQPNNILLRRRKSILVPHSNFVHGNLQLAATLNKNLETLGFTFDPQLLQKLAGLEEKVLCDLYLEVVDILSKLVGANVKHRPMYPGFPQQVMEMSDVEFYTNALVHYITDGAWLPPEDEAARLPFLDRIQLQIIKEATHDEFMSLFTALAGANTSLSDQDKTDLIQYVQTYGDGVEAFLPLKVPQKETIAILAEAFLSYTKKGVELTSKMIQTATDLLRFIAFRSGGDVSLAEKPRFKTFSRAERKFYLSLLDRISNPVEDMNRYREYWKRLGEKLHPGEYRTMFPNAYKAFQTIRSEDKIETFNSRVEKQLKSNPSKALATLTSRPGELVRRIDKLIREGVRGKKIATSISSVGDKVSTPVLLQAMEHLTHRSRDRELRIFFPKGSKAKAKAIPNTLPVLPVSESTAVVESMREVLKQRFSAMEPLGKVYVDPALAGYNLPFSQRSASVGGLKTVVRGSRIPIDSSAKVVRLFLHWKNYQGRTDVDLSAAMLSEDGELIGECAYYDRGSGGIYHSGDIVNAPNGASEFIDINIAEMISRGVRYVGMTAHVYSGATFKNIPDCFVGWMERERATSGEVFDARAVKHKIDVTADSTCFIPAVFDVETREVIWCDLEMKTRTNWRAIGNAWGINVGGNNLRNSANAASLLFRATLEMQRPKVYDLLSLHAEARGQLVDTPEEADVVFSEEVGTQFELETLASKFMV